MPFASGPQGYRVAMAVSESGAEKYSYSTYVDVYEVAGNRRVARMPGNDDVRRPFHPGGETLFAAIDNEVRVLDLATGKMQTPLRHQQGITKLRISPERDILATLSRGSVYIWNFSSGELLSQLFREDGFKGRSVCWRWPRICSQGVATIPPSCGCGRPRICATKPASGWAAI